MQDVVERELASFIDRLGLAEEPLGLVYSDEMPEGALSPPAMEPPTPERERRGEVDWQAVFASFAGVLLTHYNGGIGPSEASIMKSVRYVAIVAVGGMANLWGALIMGVVLNFLSLRGLFGSYDDAVFGLILILIMLFAPGGILNLRLGVLWERVGAKVKRRKEGAT